jgi:AcrR family transcriptional regulator
MKSPARVAPPARARTGARRRAVPAPRFACAPPAQQRSRETMDRFAAAAEELLREKPFEEISVKEIVARAGRPIGSFYARFAGKDALLPFIYQRYHEGLESLFAARLARVDWDALGFEESLAAMVEFLLGAYDERRWLLRAVSLFARAHPAALPADLVARRGRVYDLPIRILARHRDRIAHADVEQAVAFGVFLVSAVARERLLFGDAPHARVTPIGRRELRDELIRVLHSYLTCEAPQ